MGYRRVGFERGFTTNWEDREPELSQSMGYMGCVL